MLEAINVLGKVFSSKKYTFKINLMQNLMLCVANKNIFSLLLFLS